MLIEREIEANIITAISALSGLENAVIVGARQPSSSGIVKGEVDGGKTAVISVALGFRQHDAFSLPMVSIGGSVSIATRADLDATGETHEAVLAVLADKFAAWHSAPNSLSTLSTTAFSAGEIRLDGGSGKSYDKANAAWVESFTFTIRGSLTEA